MGNRQQEPVARAQAGDSLSSAALLEERLVAIVRAVNGGKLGANAEELWFAPAATGGVQIRLSNLDRGQCFDRSANLAISYGGQRSDEPISSAFRDAVHRIKAIDDTPIDDVAPAFPAAAQAVVQRLTLWVADRGDASNDASGDASPTHSRALWEAERTRELNVIFLDLCSRIFGRHGEELFPLHWGFWPTGTAAQAIDDATYDPQAAFSENLLAHIPESVERILDVGCGLGFNVKLLAARHKRITALSPVARHCAVIEHARLPGVDVRCGRFEELSPDEPYDLLLFSESANHFSLDTEFLEHCKRFLTATGYVLLADDLTEERARMIEAQRVFRLLRAVDITENVAPTTAQWAKHIPVVAAYHTALMSILDLYDSSLATQVREVVESLDDTELRLLFSGRAAPPTPKGRYMIYLLQRD